jgi:hypothetical protein
VLLQPFFLSLLKIVLLVTGFHIAAVGRDSKINPGASSCGACPLASYKPHYLLNHRAHVGQDMSRRPAFLLPRFLLCEEARKKNFSAHLANRILLHFGPFLKLKNALKSSKNQALTGNEEGGARRGAKAPVGEERRARLRRLKSL